MYIAMCALFYTHVHAPNVMYIIMYSNFTVSVCIQTHDLTAGGHIATQRSEAAALETAVPPRLSGTHFILSYTHGRTHLYNQTIPFLSLFPLFNRLLSNLPKCHCCSQDPYRLALPGSQARSGEITFGCH